MNDSLFWSLIVTAFLFECAWFHYLTRRTDTLKRAEKAFQKIVYEEDKNFGKEVARELHRLIGAGYNEPSRVRRRLPKKSPTIN